MLQYVDTMSACCKSKIGENIMINKKVMLFFVGGIVANVVDVGAMNMQQNTDMQQNMDMQQNIEMFRQNMTGFLETAMKMYSLPPTGVIAKWNDEQLLCAVAVSGGGNLFGPLEGIVSNPDSLSRIRGVVTCLAQKYERNHPISSRVAIDTGSLRRGIDSLFEINPKGTSAENIVRGLTNEQLAKFVADSINGISAFVRTEHPELARSFSFGQQMESSQIILDGARNISYPPFRAYIAYVVGMYERDHPRTPGATAGV
jgi:hypothetical protein